MTLLIFCFADLAGLIAADGGSAGGPAGEQGVRGSAVSGSEPAAAAGPGHRQIQPQRAAAEAGRGEVDRLRTG